MKEFEVTFSKIITLKYLWVVEAEDERDAETQADALIGNIENANAMPTEMQETEDLESEEWEILEIQEN